MMSTAYVEILLGHRKGVADHNGRRVPFCSHATSRLARAMSDRVLSQAIDIIMFVRFIRLPGQFAKES